MRDVIFTGYFYQRKILACLLPYEICLCPAGLAVGSTLQDNANIFIYSSLHTQQRKRRGLGTGGRHGGFGVTEVQVSQGSSDALGCRWGKPVLYRNKEKIFSGQQGVRFWCLNDTGGEYVLEILQVGNPSTDKPLSIK